ncbi:N utilization substance protein B [Actinocatenispora thailandica]|uniref:Transcription antitermination protein NusB n=2 Tax=Actinocatenispora thailandica TaxID=227318 RepID=A0A7R7DPT6_9ACTN|nr:N utilization substance protein B [Actinocatenispora thailandica]
MTTVTESDPATSAGMSTRTKARKRALDVLYEADLRGEDPLAVLRRRVEWAEPPVRAYTVTLVEGYQQHAEEIDHLIATYAQGWSLSRMPAVDRNIARVAIVELAHRDDIDDAVAISEAIELATALSTDESPKFVNGLLARIAEVLHTRS